MTQLEPERLARDDGLSKLTDITAKLSMQRSVDAGQKGDRVIEMTLLKDAVDALAGRCDGAITRDNVGYNGVDTHFGHRLADMREEDWTPKQRFGVYEMIRKYRKQLLNYGIDYDEIEEPEKPAGNSDRQVRWGKEYRDFQVFFDYDPDLVTKIKQVAGSRFRNNGIKYWNVPNEVDSRGSLRQFIFDNDFNVSDEAQEMLEKEYGMTEEAEQSEPERLVEFDGKMFHVYFPYSQELVDAMRDIPGRKFISNGEKHWTVPNVPDSCIDLQAMIDRYEFTVSDEVFQKIQEMIDKAAELKQLSAAVDSNGELEIEGLGGTLRPFQKAAVEYALRAKRCFLAEEMGLGKTIEALATIQAADAYPAIVICPASLKYNWRKEALKWLPGKKVIVLNGGKPSGEILKKMDIIILNYDILKKWAEVLKDVGAKCLILDESHYIKNHKAQRTEMVKELIKGIEYRLLLTGTPVLNRPQELLSQLSAMGMLDAVGGFWNFANRYCQAHQTQWGWDFSGAAHLDELNEKMRASCYVRHEKKDVLRELPDKTRTNIPVEIDNRREYERAAQDVIEYAAHLSIKDKEFQESIKDLPGNEKKTAIRMRMDSAVFKAERAEQLVKIEVLKQVAAKGKMNAIKDWVGSFVDTGEKLVIFGWHRNIVEEIAEVFGARKITGDTPAQERQDAVDEFQENQDVKVIACNIQAGGVGITLTAASNVVFVEFGWNPGTMDQAEDRVHRIGQTYPVNVWNIVGEDTIDEDIIELIESKRTVVDSATAGHKTDIKSIIQRLSERHS